MARALPDKQFVYSGLVPNVQTSINDKTTYLKAVVLSNITAADALVTLKDGSGATRATISVSARDVWEKSFEDGWDFVSGMSILCDTASAIQAEFTGFQNYL